MIEQAIRRETLLPVVREVAWRALRDAQGLESWLADEVLLDVREGAEGRLRWRSGEERLARSRRSRARARRAALARSPAAKRRSSS